MHAQAVNERKTLLLRTFQILWRLSGIVTTSFEDVILNDFTMSRFTCQKSKYRV